MPDMQLELRVLDVSIGGCALWLPHDLPPWKTVYHYFRLWHKNGTWEKINDALRDGNQLGFIGAAG